MGNMELVVEVAMGDNPRELDHIKKHLDKEFTIWVACRNQEIRKGLKQRIKEHGLDQERVAFRLVRDFRELETASV